MSTQRLNYHPTRRPIHSVPSEVRTKTARQVFKVYALAFEACLADECWDRLAQFFWRDSVYEVCNVSFAGVLTGREEILRGLAKSVAGFDHKMASRSIKVLSPPVLFGLRLHAIWRATYTRPTAPPVRLQATSCCTVVNGRIAHLVDTYHGQSARAFEDWMQVHGGDLDPSYGDPLGG